MRIRDIENKKALQKIKHTGGFNYPTSSFRCECMAADAPAERQEKLLQFFNVTKKKYDDKTAFHRQAAGMQFPPLTGQPRRIKLIFPELSSGERNGATKFYLCGTRGKGVCNPVTAIRFQSIGGN